MLKIEVLEIGRLFVIESSRLGFHCFIFLSRRCKVIREGSDFLTEAPRVDILKSTGKDPRLVKMESVQHPVVRHALREEGTKSRDGI